MGGFPFFQLVQEDEFIFPNCVCSSAFFFFFIAIVIYLFVWVICLEKYVYHVGCFDFKYHRIEIKNFICKDAQTVGL